MRTAKQQDVDDRRPKSAPDRPQHGRARLNEVDRPHLEMGASKRLGGLKGCDGIELRGVVCLLGLVCPS